MSWSGVLRMLSKSKIKTHLCVVIRYKNINKHFFEILFLTKNAYNISLIISFNASTRIWIPAVNVAYYAKASRASFVYSLTNSN